MTDLSIAADPRPLGRSGLIVSPIAWGMWRFTGVSPAHGRALIEAALAAGVTLFDTADIYGFDGGKEKTAGGFGAAEALLGEVLADAPGLRERMVLATKGGIAPPVPYDSSGGALMAALDASLRRLRVEAIDLYQIHRPDLLAHPQELARALEDMVAAGKVRAVGVSNFTLEQTRTLLRFLSVPLASQQPEFSPLHLAPLTDGLLDLAMAEELATLAWSPLGGARLAQPETPRERAVAAALDLVAAKFGVSRTAAALGWIMAHPARVIPIVGTQRVERVAELPSAFEVRWSRRDWYDVLVAARGAPLP